MATEPEPKAPTRGTPADNPLFVGSLAEAFQVLETLNTAGRPLGLTELARLSGLNLGVVQRVTHTLRVLGYLRQHTPTRAFTLSSRMLEFGHTVLATNRIREHAQPHLEALNRHTGETVNLMELEGSEIVYVARFPSVHAVSVDLHIGSRLPAFCTAAGRAILSLWDEPRALEFLTRTRRLAMTAHTVTELNGLQRALAQARRAGYALNDQEAFVGDISIAVALVGRSGGPVAAVNIAVPSPRWKVEKVRRVLAPLLIDTARTISMALSDD